MRSQRGVISPELLGVIMTVALAAVCWGAVAWDDSPTDAEIRASEMEALGSIAACTDEYQLPLPQEAQAEPKPVQEPQAEPVSTEPPGDPMTKLALAWLIQKGKPVAMGFGAAAVLFLLFKFFRGTHLLCWFKHKKRYGAHVWWDNRKDRFYVTHLCDRCEKVGREYLGRGIWKIADGKLIRDNEAYLRGETQAYVTRTSDGNLIVRQDRG